MEGSTSKRAYSDHKALWHLDDIKSLRDGHQIVPKQVQLIISDLCSHACSFCAYRRPDGFSSEQFGVIEDGKLNVNPNRMISADKAKEILHDCWDLGVKAIQFTGGGEPTVHPHCIDIFGYAQQLGLETALVSHGNILRPGWECVYPKMSWIRISIDAGTPETYAAVRKVHPSFFSKALQHVSKIRQAIDASESPCLLGVGYVITTDNWIELYDGVRMIRDAGAHNVRLSAMFSKAGDAYYQHHLEDIKHEIWRTMQLQTPHFKVVNMFGERMSDLKQHAPDYDFCGYQQFNMYIGGNLKVYRCCSTAYTLHGEVGDLTHQSFREWFHSHEKYDNYQNFKARSCQVCQFNNKNVAINYAIDKSPAHVNFV